METKGLLLIAAVMATVIAVASATQVVAQDTTRVTQDTMAVASDTLKEHTAVLKMGEGEQRLELSFMYLDAHTVKSVPVFTPKERAELLTIRDMGFHMFFIEVDKGKEVQFDPAKIWVSQGEKRLFSPKKGQMRIKFKSKWGGRYGTLMLFPKEVDMAKPLEFHYEDSSVKFLLPKHLTKEGRGTAEGEESVK